MTANMSIFDYLKNDIPLKYKLSINNLYEQNICNEDKEKEIEKPLHNLILNIKNNKINEEKEYEKNINQDDNIDTKLSVILNNKSYYRYKCITEEKFLESILYITNEQFLFSSEKSKNQLIKDFRNQTYFESENKLELFKKNKLNKIKIQENLISNSNINNETKIYIGELLNINIIIIYDIEEYHILNNFKDNRKNVLLFYNKGSYNPLLNQNNLHYIDNNIVDKIKSSYKQKYKTNDKEKLKEIKTMKMPELYKICEEMNINIYRCKKKKIKKDLLEEIINKI